MKEREDNRFIRLVLSLHSSGWIALGKVASPLSGKVERDLDSAGSAIDMLEMLKEKTAGNLSEEEAGFITGCLSALQMSYVEEVRAEKSDASEKSSS